MMTTRRQRGSANISNAAAGSRRSERRSSLTAKKNRGHENTGQGTIPPPPPLPQPVTQTSPVRVNESSTTLEDTSMSGVEQHVSTENNEDENNDNVDNEENECDLGIPAEVSGGVGMRGSADDVSAMSTYVDPRNFHLTYNFRALKEKMSSVHPDIQRSVEGAIQGLIKEVEDLASREAHLNSRLKVLTQGYKAQCGKGWKKFAKDMKGIDLMNNRKIRECINTSVPDMILKPGWYIFSQKETAFSYKFIRYSAVTLTAGFQGWKDYWDNYLAPTINYQLGNKRNNLVQKIRRNWMCECVACLSSLQYMFL